MTDLEQSIRIRPLQPGERVPYELLLLADPSEKQIETYLPASELYLAVLHETIVGVFVLYPVSATSTEIKNLAVHEAWQGKGLGGLLIREAIRLAKEASKHSILIATANSSISQLYLYQKNGFEICGIDYHFFTNQYPGAIYENGIRAKHLIRLSREL